MKRYYIKKIIAILMGLNESECAKFYHLTLGFSGQDDKHIQSISE